MSQRDRAPGVAVNFAPPQPSKRALPLLLIGLTVAMAGVLILAVIQLLLR